MADLTQHEIESIVQQTVATLLADSSSLPACRLETARMEAVERTLRSLSVILTGGDNPENGLVAKTIRQDGALATNRNAIDEVKKAVETKASLEDLNTIKDGIKTRGNREWQVWLGILSVVILQILNLVLKSP